MNSEALRPSVLTSGLLSLLVVLVGCGNSTGYEIPDDMCGRAVEPSALKPLLPSGGEVKAEQRATEDGESECSVFVDKVNVLTISEHRGQNKFDVMEFVRENRDRFANPEKSDVGDDTVTSDDWLMSMNACSGRGMGDYYVLDVTLAGKRDAAKSQELERFARSYLPEAMKKMGCTE
ncbi:hypothetical protein HTV45_21865 [Streptomyces sp. CHD11]|uniref:hypothetical protein n=1 Tax=Streptomyces sp. CHD11 TaxID=2741325 RepID=UPI001BFC9C34|nr:hypothetical protein [Streptomyces sp. CHD11]MBT3153480.1 hypothetical protein [Streptomyces sp. CHD11]